MKIIIEDTPNGGSKKIKAKYGVSVPAGRGSTVAGNMIYPMWKPNQFLAKPQDVNSSISAVPRDQSDLEAEGGETALLPNVGGLSAHYKIKGPRHSAGGVPLSLPDDSFIFSDTNKMKIKDPDILAMFGKTGKVKSGTTPADLAKKYDINKFRLALQDEDSEDLQKKTAEQMIANYNLKLAKLSLIQESKKGFPDGIPAVALPYLATTMISPKDVLPLRHPDDEGSQDQDMGPESQEQQFSQDGGPLHAGSQDWANFGNAMMKFGGNKKYPGGGQPNPYQVTVKDAPYIDQHGSIYSVPETPDFSTMDINSIVNYYKNIQNNQNMHQEARQKANKLHTESNARVSLKKDIQNAAVSGDYPEVERLQKLLGYLGQEPSYTFPTTAPVLDKSNIQIQPTKNDTIYSKEPAPFKYGGNLPKAQEGKIVKYPGGKYTVERADGSLIGYNPDGTVNKVIPAANKTSKANNASSSNSTKQEGITAWPGDKYGPEKGINKSNYTTEQWKQLKDKFCPECKTNKDLQNKILAHPAFSEDVKALHQKYGLPGAGVMDDGKLGHRWDFAFKYKPEESSNQSTTTQDEPRKDIIPGTLNEPARSAPANFWAQDAIQTAGAAGDFMRIRKQLPWAPNINPVLPDPTFYDPTRALANNTEQMNIGTQGASTFGNPQQYASTFSKIQGEGARNAANILSDYENKNVGIANQFEGMRAGILNRANEQNAQIATDLYDKTTMANDNFERSKNMARQQLRSSFINSITNRAQTQALNSVYPDYQVDPTSGGLVKFQPRDRTISPQQSYDQTAAKIAMIKQYQDAKIGPEWFKDIPIAGDKPSMYDLPPGYGQYGR